jgi:Tol biopolymer transport system component
MALSPDGKLLAYGICGAPEYWGCPQYKIILWDMATHQPSGQPLIFDVGAPAPLDLLFSPDGKALAVMNSVTTGSGIVQLFDITTRQPIAKPLGGKVQFCSMAFSPDGNMALGVPGGEILIWGAKEGAVLKDLKGEGLWVDNLAFSPDGKTLASHTSFPLTTGTGQKLVLWDLGTQQPIGQPLMSQITPGAIATGITFSPDGKTLASIDEKGAITLWDVATRQPIGQPLMGQSTTGGVGVTTSLAFSPDGKTLASGADDGTITLWDLAASSHGP